MTDTGDHSDRSTEIEDDDGLSPGAREMVNRRRFMQAGAAAAVGAAGLAGGSPAVAQSVAQQSCEGEFEKFEVGGGDFTVMNNRWTDDNAEQCIYVNEDGSYGWDFESPGDGPNYPEVYIGERPWGEDTGVSEFKDAQRGEIDELTIEYDTTTNIGGGEWNLALEWWLTDTTIPEPPIPDEPPFATHEIMLVLNHGGGHSHGSIMSRNVIDDQYGNTIHHWSDNVSGGVSNARFHVFVLDQLSDSGQVDLKEIMDYLSDSYGVSDNRYFSGIEVGTEYWPGASGDITVDMMNVTVNGTTYTSGSESSTGPSEPSAPSSVSTSNVGTSSADASWASVENANEYEVFLDDSSEGKESSTSTTLTSLDPDTSYTVGVEAINDAGRSDRETASFTTEEEEQTGPCENAEGGSTEVDGQTVCDVDGNGDYRDVTGDGTVGQGDVGEFFSKQHRDAWKQPDMFDFSGNGEVTHGDVVELADYVALNG